MRQMFRRRERKGTNQASDPVAAEQEKDPSIRVPPRSSFMDRWMWLPIALSFLATLLAHHDRLLFAATGVLLCLHGRLRDRKISLYEQTLTLQRQMIARWEFLATNNAQTSHDLTIAGWITPECNLILIERHPNGIERRKIPPTGSQPIYYLPGPNSSKWRAP